MLARSFLSAEALGISEGLHDALIHVLHMLERDELGFIPGLDLYTADYLKNFPKGNIFCMNYEMRKEACGTVACIGGWAALHAGLKTEDGVGYLMMKWTENPEIKRLFYPEAALAVYEKITPQQAAAVLSQYLQTGKVEWEEII